MGSPTTRIPPTTSHDDNLSLREIEELLFERGVIVSYETIRR